MLRGYAGGARLPELFRDVAGGRLPEFFGDMWRTQEEMNRLFSGLRLALRTEFPPVNVWASPDGAVVMAQAPGVSPETLDMMVHQDTATLRGNREPEPLGEDAVVLRRERPQGPFSRTIVLPYRVDADHVSARFERGVLTVELPRPASEKPRHVKVVHA